MVAEGTLTGKFADFTATNSSYVYNQLMDAAVTMCLSYDTIVSTMLFSSIWLCFVPYSGEPLSNKIGICFDSSPWKLHVFSIVRQFFGCSRASHTCRRSVIGNKFSLLQSNSPANTTTPYLMRERLHMKLETATNIKLLMDWTER